MTTAPAAKQIPTARVHHGDTFTDEYAWLADKENPETIAFLEAENAYTEVMTAGQADLRAAIFTEIQGRNQQTDLTVPVRKGGWWYYSRTIEGKQYSVHCRRAVGEPGERPPISEDGAPLTGEEILLDGNELAGDQPFFSIGSFSVSPDGGKLAFSTDYTGAERFILKIKDLVTGEIAPDEIPDTYYGAAWSRDGSALFYVTVDDAWRSYRIWRPLTPPPAADDQVVFTETDERFFASIDLTRSERYLMISTASKLSSEVLLLRADDPAGEFDVVVPRRQGLEYSVDHQVAADGTERLLILHNDGAENFELATAAPEDPGAWTPLVPHRKDTRLLDVGAFEDHLMLYYRKDGLTGLRILRADGTAHDVAFDEVVYTVSPGSNPEYTSKLFRLGYVSLVTPDSVYDCDTSTGELILLKRRAVLPLPDQGEYLITDYEQFREWATADDGTKIPISLVRKKGTPEDGSAPLVLHGYGSYEASSYPYFSIPRLSELDRGLPRAVQRMRH